MSDIYFQLTIQYTLWDRLKDFGNQEPLHLTNMSKFLVHLINDRSLPLTVLKVIDFADMNKGKLTFLRKTLAGILLQKNTDNLQEIFIKIGLSDKLNLFRESVKLFMGHFMLKEENQVLTPEGETIDMSFDPKTLQVLKQRVKLAERAMSVGLSKVQF
jgi:nucleolar MIF4G domain-containing protein 1